MYSKFENGKVIDGYQVGIVGNASDKFNKITEAVAKKLILDIFKQYDRPIIISGRSPLGGVDVWAEELALQNNLLTEIKPPLQNNWEYFKKRNLEIAQCSDIVHVILVKDYPETYVGQRFDVCYHCVKYKKDYPKHIKSGGCYTGWEAVKLGKEVNWWIIDENGVCDHFEGLKKDGGASSLW